MLPRRSCKPAVELVPGGNGSVSHRPVSRREASAG